MSILSVDLNKVSVATLSAQGFTDSDMAKAVNDAVWYAYGANTDVKIDFEIAAKFKQTRLGVTGEEAISWLTSLNTDKPLPTPKPHFIPLA